jgi:hypothetical protein
MAKEELIIIPSGDFMKTIFEDGDKPLLGQAPRRFLNGDADVLSNYFPNGLERNPLLL